MEAFVAHAARERLHSMSEHDQGVALRAIEELEESVNYARETMGDQEYADFIYALHASVTGLHPRNEN